MTKKLKQTSKHTKSSSDQNQSFGEYLTTSMAMPASSSITSDGLSQINQIILALLITAVVVVTALTLRPLLVKQAATPTPAGSIIIQGATSKDLPLQQAKEIQDYQGTIGTDPVSR